MLTSTRTTAAAAWRLIAVLLFGLLLFASASAQEDPPEALSLNQQSVELYGQGRYTQALELIQRSLVLRERALGPEHPFTATSRNNLGQAYRQLGEYAKAMPALQRALEVREKIRGPEHPDTALSLNNLAELHRALGQYSQALPLVQRGLAIREKALGPEHSDTATSLHSLGALQCDMGDYAAAAASYKRALDIRTKAFGLQDPRVAEVMNSLADLSHRVAAYDNGLKLAETSLRIRQTKWPDGHPSIAASLHSLGRLQWAKGRYQDAKALLEQSLSMREKWLGSSHPSVAATLVDLAAVDDLMGHGAEALTMVQRSLAIRERVLGPRHPDVAASLNALGQIYQAAGRSKEGLDVTQRALTIREQALGPRHPDVATSLDDLGGLYDEVGDYDKALSVLQRSVAIRTSRLGRNHPDLASSLNSLAGVYESMGRYADALRYYESSLAIKERALGPEHPRVAVTLNDLALIYNRTGQFDKAIALYQRSIAIAEKVLGPEHREVGNTLSNLAVVYEDQRRYPEALAAARRALSIKEKALAPDHPDIALSLGNLAKLYAALGQYDDAWPLLERSLRINEKVFGPEHPRFASSLFDLAIVLLRLERYEQALTMAGLSLKIRAKAFGIEHPDTLNSLTLVRTLYVELKRPEEARRFLEWDEAALATLEKQAGAGSPAVAFRLASLAVTRLLIDDRQGALKYALRALPIASGAGQLGLSHAVQSALGSIFEDMGQRDQAIYWKKQAVNSLQAIRAGMKSLDSSLQSGYLDQHRFSYSGLAALLVDAGRLAEAEQVLALLKDQELFELVRSDAPRPTADLVGREMKAAEEQAALAREGVTRARELDGLERRLKAEKALPAADEARRQQLKLEQDAWSQRFQQWAATLATTFAAAPADEQAQRATAERQSTRLQTLVRRDEGGAIGLHYVVTDERLSIIVATPRGSFGKHVPIKRAELNRQVAVLRQALQNPKVDPRPAAQALYRTLIEPVSAELQAAQARTLVLSLTDTLRYVPFGALHDGSQYLIERYAVSQIILGADQKAEASRGDWRVAGLGMTQAVPSFRALPGVRSELEGIVRTATSTTGVLPGRIRLDKDFDRGTLEESLRGDYRVVHIGSHFVFRPGDQSNSFLLLGDGSRLTLGQIAGLDFNDVDLLTLSACDTATGGGTNEYGAEVEGLATAVARQGAQTVLATLWPVADPSTAQLMQRFYQAHVGASALSRAQALRQAQRALLSGSVREGAAVADVERSAARAAPEAAGEPAFAVDRARPFAHPYYWAPFVLMGNWL